MFIITSEEAEKHVKPPELSKILVDPSQLKLKVGTKQTFRVKGIDQFGRNIEIENITWSATGGDIEPDGVFMSGGDEGNFIVSAKVEKISGVSEITIAKESEPESPEPPEVPQKLTWTGEVTPQKWMNFYTKILTKFVKDGPLDLNVSFKASPAGGIKDQQVEETKAALRELGLNDDVHKE